MSSLLTHATRRPTSFGRAARGARVDERTLLNLPEFDGGAYEVRRLRSRHRRRGDEARACKARHGGSIPPGGL